MRGTHEKVLLEKYYFYLLFKFFFLILMQLYLMKFFLASRHLIFKKKNALVHEEFLFHEDFNNIGYPDFNHV